MSLDVAGAPRAQRFFFPGVRKHKPCWGPAWIEVAGTQRSSQSFPGQLARQRPWLQRKTQLLLHPKAAVPGAAGAGGSWFFLFNLSKAGTWRGWLSKSALLRCRGGCASRKTEGPSRNPSSHYPSMGMAGFTFCHIVPTERCWPKLWLWHRQDCSVGGNSALCSFERMGSEG